MIGIWGAGGIGKSTIARAVYNNIADNFEALCFLSNVRKQSEMPNGLSHLQETLLWKLVMEKHHKLGDYHEGIPIIKHRLSKRKILLILDDVDKSDQLKALAGSCKWFGAGSRIIITTRNKQLLASHDIKSIYDVKELNGEESLELLNWYAFGNKTVDSNYMDVCNRAIRYSCGFPLALEVIGSNLRGKGVNLWRSALNQFKSKLDKSVLDALKLSYDTLGGVEKQVFLDLACFFNGKKLVDVIDIMQCVRGIQPSYAIEMLIDKSLIKILQDHVTMHDLIEDVGKDIVRKESSYEPGERSRLWFYEDILHVLQQDTGTNKVEVIILDLPKSLEVQWSGEAFMKMKNLKMLVIRNACFSECPKYLPNSLRWLEWTGYPSKVLPYHMHPTELVYLDLSTSHCELLQPFDKKFHNLSHINLRNCKFLQEVSDLSGASNLRELWLDDCTNLIEIHDSVGCLSKLRELSAMRCRNLKTLPSCLRSTSLKHLNLLGCSSVQRFPEISVVMENMRTLDLDSIGITELPFSIYNLIGLEMLHMARCPNLKQLPSSIFTLPNLWRLSTSSCVGMSHFVMCEGGDNTSLDCSLAMSLKMEQLYFSNCNLSNASLAFCLSHFTNLIYLDLRFNSITILPVCIKEHHSLKYLWLDNCNQLQHIEGMPPNLEHLSATSCTSLTNLSKSKVIRQAFNFEPGRRNFILPGKRLPERIHHYSRGNLMSFWVCNVFPQTFIWICVKNYRDSLFCCELSVKINEDIWLEPTSMWYSGKAMMTNHIHICDLQSIFLDTERALENEWNKVTISISCTSPQSINQNYFFFGVHVYNLQSNLENIRFMEPKTCIIDNNLLQKIQEQDWEELDEEDMDLDSDSIKSAESYEFPLHYEVDQPLLEYGEVLEDDMHQDSYSVKFTKDQDRPQILEEFENDDMHQDIDSAKSSVNQEREIMNWDLEILKVGGFRGETFLTWRGRVCSYYNLTRLRLTNCDKCWRIPSLGQLPALKSLTIGALQSVVSLGSEFFKAEYCASPVPFPSLESLYFYQMTSWREWSSIDTEAFPKLHTLRLSDCPRLVGTLPPQLVSLEFLQISGSPLLASSIPKCPKIHTLIIYESENVVLQEQDLLLPSLRILEISGTHMLESLSQKLHNIKDLTIQDCFNVGPLRAFDMPPLVEQLDIINCENVNLLLASKVPLVHLQRISISHCEFLTSLFDGDMEYLVPNLKELCIERCSKLEPFSLGLLPSSLKQLEIRDCDKLLTCHIEWSHLPSITKLRISTPFDTLYCNGLQHLTSLQELEILYSHKLEKIEGGMMPPFLQRLHISNCCLLKEQCRNKDKEIWPKISHVSCISLDDTYLIRGLEYILEDQDMYDSSLDDQDVNGAIILEDQDPCILEDQEMNDATIQVQSPPPARLRGMIKFFKGCFKIN